MARQQHALESLTHRSILAIAVPVMVSNVSTALIGVVDTGVVGRLPEAAFIGAVALGSLIFSFAFWGFGFLRMGTTGLTAQALGAEDKEEVAAVLIRALLIAIGIGGVLILLQWPIREIAFALVDGSDRVEQLSRRYFDIRIWAAPMTLANYALLGWFIGLGRTGTGLVLQLVLNLTNISLDAILVLGFGLDVDGVAIGTVAAEASAMVVGLALAVRQLGRGQLKEWNDILNPQRLRRTFTVSADIMLRTLALVLVFVWFTAQGASQGDVVLAANTILMHFVSVSAYFLDGLAFATEALVGRAIGAAWRQGLTAAARITSQWAALTAGLSTLALFALGPALIDALTIDPASRTAARDFLPWAGAAPLVGVWAFQLDGIFIGATRTKDMRNAMLLATSIFLAAWWLLTPFGNHGLWAALYVHYLARIASLGMYYPKLLGSVPMRSETGTIP